MPREGLTPGHG